MIPNQCVQVPSLRDELSEIIWEVEQGGAYTIIGGDNQPRAVLIGYLEYERLHDACGKHTASPAEHTCRTDLMEALEVSLAQAKADLDQGGKGRNDEGA